MQKEEDFEKIKQEESMEWWRPGKQDGYSLERKLMRAGCRNIQRKAIECTRNANIEYKICMEYQTELEKCQQLLTFLYQTKSVLD